MKGKKSLVGSMVSAIISMLCCLPAVLIFLGVGSVTAASLMKYSPYFSVISLLSLAMAFYFIYLKPKKDCGSVCETDRKNKIQKILFWIIAVFVISMITFPYLM